MNSYEIVKKNIEFDSPDRIAFKFPSFEKSDILRLFVQPPRQFRTQAEYSVLKKAVPLLNVADEWGIMWDARDKSGLGQPINNPLKTLESLKNFNFPNPCLNERFDGIENALQIARTNGKIVQLNSQYCLFERFHMLRGFENALIDLYEDTELVAELLDKLLEYQIGIVRSASKLSNGGIHIFETSDDWGTQNALIVNPQIFKELFLPRYKILVDEVHKNNMYFNLHSCGRINDIMDDIISIGVDIVNIHQPNILNLKEFGQKYAGKICFDVSVDIQKTLPTNNRELIENEVKDLIKYWGTKKGGIIAAEYRFTDSIGTGNETMQFELECFEKYGNLRSNDEH